MKKNLQKNAKKVLAVMTAASMTASPSVYAADLEETSGYVQNSDAVEAQADSAEAVSTEIGDAGTEPSPTDVPILEDTEVLQEEFESESGEIPETDAKITEVPLYTKETEPSETPEAGEETPESGEETPEAGEETPESGEETPESGEEIPEAGEETPEAGEETPEAGEETFPEVMEEESEEEQILVLDVEEELTPTPTPVPIYEEEEIPDGWVQEGDNWCYYEYGEKLTDTEIYAGSDEATGNSLYYVVDSDGNRIVSAWYNDEYGNPHYCNADGYKATGMVEVDGNIYCFDNYGDLQINTQYSVYNSTEEKWINYRADENGCLVTGWYEDSYGNTFYYDSDGREAEGFQVIDGVKYYFSYGLYKDCVFSVYDEESDSYKVYCADESGQLVTGWVEAEWSSDILYYYHEDGHRAEGLTDIDGNAYYFNPDNGQMEKNIAVVANGCFIVFGDDGIMIDNKTVTGDGWIKSGSEWYYIQDGDVLRDQMLVLNGKTYYLEYDGKMAKDTTVDIYSSEDEKWHLYRFDENGHMLIDEWYTDEADNVYYYDENGYEASGFVTIDGSMYYFRNYLYKDCTFWVYDYDAEQDYCYHAAEDGHLISGWYTDTWDDVYYFGEDGRRKTGVQIIDGDYYFFDDYMRTDYAYSEDGNFYYFGEDGYAEVVKDISGMNNQWFSALGEWYYVQNGKTVCDQTLKIGSYYYGFDGFGKMLKNTEWHFYEEDGSYSCRFDENGHAVIGWYTDYEESTYYYDENGRSVSGFQTIDGKTYYFSPYGSLQSNRCMEQDGFLYYLDGTGVLTKKVSLDTDGWKEMPDGWYYSKSGKLLRSEFVKSGSYTYYLDELGLMVQGRECWITDEDETDYSYRFDENGHMITGWYDHSGSLYYYDEEGRGLRGLHIIDGDTYYFGYDSEVIREEAYQVDGVLYYFGLDGKMEKKADLSTDGWKQMPNGWYYAKDGKLIRDEFIQSGKYTYYLGYGGLMSANGEEWIDGYYYRFDKNGHMITGWYDDGDSKYYYLEDGKCANGIQVIEEETFCFGYDGRLYTNRVVESEGMLYYFGEDGLLEKQVSLTSDGWKLLPKGWYYAKDGKLIKNEFVQSGKYTYYMDYEGCMVSNVIRWIWDAEAETDSYYGFDEDGHMVFGWFELDGWTYYFGEDGRAVTGIQEIDGKTYGFYNDGELMTDSTVRKDGILYYFGKDGVLVEKASLETDGWKKIQGTWYYAKNGDVLTGFQKIGNTTYYFNNSGAMLCDTDAELYDPEEDEYYYFRFTKSGSMVTGWYQEGDDWYYYQSDGKAANGIVTIGTKKYAFNYSGRMLVNRSEYDGSSLYYFGADGALVKEVSLDTDGWKQMPDGWYYVKNKRVLCDSFFNSGKYTYYFDGNGRMAENTVCDIYDEETDDWYFYRFDKDGHMVTGWYRTTEQTWYYYDSKGRAVSGIQEVNGVLYCFGYEGKMETETTWEADGILYYFGANGKVTKQVSLSTEGWKEMPDGWYYAEGGKLKKYCFLTLGSVTYYLDSDGKMLTDREIEVYSDDTETYDFYRLDKKGHVITGWYQTSYGQKFYYGENGKAANGICEVDGELYYFDYDGSINQNVASEKDGTLYYFGSDGKMIKKLSLATDGWKLMPDGWYYASNKKLVKNQFLTLGSHTYYLSWNGRMLSDENYQIYDKETDSHKYYRFDKNGCMVTGWYQDLYTGNRYLYGNDGAAQIGVQEISGKVYHFNDEGLMTVNKEFMYNGTLYEADGNGVGSKVTTSGWYEDKTYYLSNGKAVTGWKSIDGKWYYFSKEDGMKYSNREIGIDGKTYVFNSDGSMQKGWIKKSYGPWWYADDTGALVENGWYTIGSKKYYFSDKEIVSGIVEIDGTYQLFGTDGAWTSELVSKGDGWYLAGTDYYYMQNGKMASNTVITIGSAIYGFDENGIMRKNTWYGQYYFGSSGAAYVNRWLKCEGNMWQYYGADGKAIGSGWKKLGTVWYYFEDGYAVQNDKAIGGSLYHFSASGASDGVGTALKTGWNLIDGEYYYYEKGALVTGWKTVGSSRYYFNSDGTMAYLREIYDSESESYYFADKNGRIVTNGWFDVPEHLYTYGYEVSVTGKTRGYAGADGKLVDGLQTIDGKQYYFSGYCLVWDDCISSDGTTLYVIDENGVVTDIKKASANGWMKSAKGRWYYVKDGRFVRGLHVINGKQYGFLYDGSMGTDCITDNVYLDANGLVHADGWYNGIYFRDGEYVYGAWNVEGKNYYFRGGVPQKGLYFTDGAYYYYDGKGTRTKASLKEGLNTVEGSKYYVENGMLYQGMKEIGGKQYYFGENGRMTTNSFVWVNSNRKLYVGADGIAVTGWKTIDGRDYYFDANGRMLTGLQKIDGKNYMFTRDGALVK